MKKLILNLLVILASSVSIPASAAVVYVKSDVSGGDGTSWQTAFADIHEALDAAQQGDEIWIAAGIYKPTRIADNRVATSRSFILKDGVSLYGGFAGTESAKSERELVAGGRPWEFVNETVLDGDDDIPDVWVREITPGTTYRNTWMKEDNQIPGTASNASHLLFQPNTIVNPTVVDGLTIRRGNANQHRVKCSGGGIYAVGNVSINACRFYENACWLRNEVLDNINALGGAVYLNGAGEASVTNCHFERNYANSSYSQGLGGGLFAANARIENCLFEDCVGEDGGGATYVQGGSLKSCEIRRSYASAGGGLYASGVFNAAGQVLATVDVADVKVSECQGLNGGGVYADLGAVVTHALVYGCKADATEFGDDLGGHGGGIFINGGTVFGCVAYNNMAFMGAGLCIRDGKSANCTLQHNANRNADPAVSNLDEWPGTGALGYVTNTIGNPDADASNFIRPTSFIGLPGNDAQLAELDAADWSLAEGSDFIDAGVATEGQESTDMAGNPRESGRGIDVGAYEYTATATVEPGAVLTFDGKNENVVISYRISEGEIKFVVGSGTYVPASQQANVNKAIELPLGGETEVRILADGLSRLGIVGQGLTAIDVSGAPLLTMLQVGQNALTQLDVTANPLLTGIYAEDNAIASVDLSNNHNLRVLQIFNNKLSGKLDLAGLSDLSSVDIDFNAVEELILPKHDKLVEINCEGNKLTSLDIAGRAGLRDVNVYGNKLSSLDVTGLAALEALYAGSNEITEVAGLADCRVLETLNLSGNRLTAIDISVVPSVTGLYLYDNELTSLDVTANTAISWMNINNNHIGALDISGLSNLRLLHACGNELAELDLSNSPYCSQLTVADNRLTALDVSRQSALYWLKADGNMLETIDLSKNTYLSLLELGRNRLSALSLSTNTMLRRLSAEENEIAAIDIAGLTSLCGVELQGNRFDAASLNAFIANLPDVSGQEPLEGSEWISILNISDMPGTSGADVAAAQAKGWRVTAETSGVDGIDAGSNDVVEASYYSLDGRRLPSPQGLCIVRMTLADGRKIVRKVVY